MALEEQNVASGTIVSGDGVLCSTLLSSLEVAYVLAAGNWKYCVYVSVRFDSLCRHW